MHLHSAYTTTRFGSKINARKKNQWCTQIVTFELWMVILYTYTHIDVYLLHPCDWCLTIDDLSIVESKQIKTISMILHNKYQFSNQISAHCSVLTRKKTEHYRNGRTHDQIIFTNVCDERHRKIFLCSFSSIFRFILFGLRIMH